MQSKTDDNILNLADALDKPLEREMAYSGSEESSTFEFERKFFVSIIPEIAFAEPAASLIIQNYVISNEGTCLRVRMMADLEPDELSFHQDGDAHFATTLLQDYAARFSFASVGVKSPPVGGTRYEKEMQIDVDVARKLMGLNGALVAKQRYGFFLSGDGWNLDVFADSNFPLKVAECERSGPVTNLVVPNFCSTEVTDQLRFANDSLAYNPFSTWSTDFYRELETGGRQIDKDF